MEILVIFLVFIGVFALFMLFNEEFWQGLRNTKYFDEVLDDAYEETKELTDE